MAVTLTLDELIEAACLDDVDAASAARLLGVGIATVERYAPLAPEVVQNEAVVRVVGWLVDSPASNIMAANVGEVRHDFAVGQLSALRHSGAMALLGPWKVRRAGAI